MRKRYSRQQLKRKMYSKCFFCENDNPLELDTHRIFAGEDGGTYDKEGRNLLSLCAGCHRKVHAKSIQIDIRKYQNTLGDFLVHYWIDGKEYWKQEILCPEQARQ